MNTNWRSSIFGRVSMPGGFVALVLIYALGPSLACSISRNGPSTTNYELVRLADDIVLARAESSKVDRAFERIQFKVIRSLKGEYKAQSIALMGHTNPQEYRGASADGDFSRARPGTYAGMCKAIDYKIGKTYLLFLAHRAARRDDGEELKRSGGKVWEAGITILARDREEVAEKGSAWVRAVELYTGIGSLNNYEKEKAALEELRARAAAKTDTVKYPPALVADIDRFLLNASWLKSTADLLVLYDDPPSPAVREDAAQVLAYKVAPEAFGTLRSHVRHEALKGGYLDYFLKVKHTDRVAVFVEHFLDETNEENLLVLANAMVQVATAADEAEMLRALPAIRLTSKSGKVVASWFQKHPSEQSSAILKNMEMPAVLATQ